MGLNWVIHIDWWRFRLRRCFRMMVIWIMDFDGKVTVRFAQQLGQSVSVLYFCKIL